MADGPAENPKRSYWQGAVKLAVAVGVAILTFWCVAYRTSHLTDAKNAAASKTSSVVEQNAVPPPEKERVLPEAKGAAVGQLPSPAAKSSASGLVEKAVPGMKETNDLIINWSIAIFGATLAIAVLAKGAKIRDGNGGLVS